ncbi:hypothetical protein IE53DRAFT_16280 [Violaceomyces palustris]|uniref:Uncharacterized protein n=2 Tax=Violaceomyces palustris TaxID=1673888 RepID=A0ACD0P218_9BASI|nr:hypothetical protein IE53DRAFT_16263 [Violaceomyces palustris]PWN52153.1 hypothetical protein IE53DRAFT_16280 [Violaceomyces palustris]
MFRRRTDISQPWLERNRTSDWSSWMAYRSKRETAWKRISSLTKKARHPSHVLQLRVESISNRDRVLLLLPLQTHPVQTDIQGSLSLGGRFPRRPLSTRSLDRIGIWIGNGEPRFANHFEHPCNLVAAAGSLLIHPKSITKKKVFGRSYSVWGGV